MSVSPYSYAGASWGANATRNRNRSMAQAKRWGQAAPQRNELAQQWAQLGTNQQLMNKDLAGQRFRFGINALTGLMR